MDAGTDPMEMTEEEIRAWKKRLQEEGEQPRPFGWAREAQKWTGHAGAVTALAVTADGKVVSASTDGTVKVWDLASGDLRGNLEGHAGPVCGVAVTTDGKAV